ncbi:MAG: lactate utilization protein [Paludibacter sp.]|nr:lactate utilization protein [Paludibacter sp.]
MLSSSREEILKRIAAVSKGRSAFVDNHLVDNEPIYKSVLPDAVTCFKKELEAINGQCILCENDQDAYQKIKSLLQEKSISSVFCRNTIINEQLAQFDVPSTSDKDQFIGMAAGISECEFLIARTGSVLVSSASESGRQMNVFPPIHLVLAHVSQLVETPEDALNAIQLKYGDFLPSTITTITGPSRTADIEKTLVLGAHGPKEFIVFLSVL